MWSRKRYGFNFSSPSHNYPSPKLFPSSATTKVHNPSTTPTPYLPKQNTSTLGITSSANILPTGLSRQYGSQRRTWSPIFSLSGKPLLHTLFSRHHASLGLTFPTWNSIWHPFSLLFFLSLFQICVLLGVCHFYTSLSLSQDSISFHTFVSTPCDVTCNITHYINATRFFIHSLSCLNSDAEV